MDKIKVTIDLAREHGLSEEEFEKVKSILGRTPNYTELGIFSVMWSEHCSYKSSISELKKLPRDGNKMCDLYCEDNSIALWAEILHVY